MNIPELPDSDEVVELREIKQEIRKLGYKLDSTNYSIKQLVDALTQMNEKLSSTEKKLDNIWNRLYGVGYLSWIALILVFMMWAILSMKVY